MKGWILDVYPDYMRNEIVVWLKNEKGKPIRLTDAFTPGFYISADKHHVNELIEELAPFPYVCGIYYDREKRLLDGTRPKNLLRIDVSVYSQLRELAKKINGDGEFTRYRLYNVDVNLALRYIFEKKISPMLLLSVEKTLDGVRYETLEDLGDLYYHVPGLKEIALKVKVRKQGRLAKTDDPLESITLASGDETLTFEGDEAGILADFVEAVQGLDPDVVYTDGGDSHDLPYLYHRAMVNELGKDFQLGREPRSYKPLEGRTYFTYGRVVYKPASYALRGRVHIDRSHFMFRESGTQGLVDLTRFAGIPLQMLSRMSPGNAITTMQLRYALEKGILVPWKRQGCEYFKTAWKLLYSDRGGYIFDSKIGIYDNVAELDFASMYPNIMVKHNISPETVLCRCCQDSEHRVPLLDYNVCEKRVGLVPRVLKPVVERRFAYKRLMREARDEEKEAYKQRQAILKWLLITSFGYQGYRNARFGRIESHEAICAYGRELLLKAKEVAEYFGFEVLHGLVDSLWVRGKARVEHLEELCELISAEIGIDMNLEGRYRWIVFLPNRSNGVGALNRYYGLFEDGELKVRGVETRMRSTPGIIISYQKDILRELAHARSIEEFHAILPGTFRVLRKYAEDLRMGRVNPEDMVYTVTASKSLAEYRVNNFSYAALRQLKQEGVELHPGQHLHYIVTDHKSRRYHEKVRIAEAWQDEDGYDAEFYIKHLLKATESLLLPFGYTTEKLECVLRGQEQSSLQCFAKEG
jgi:DNA polymerase elongation subunit (family B)